MYPRRGRTSKQVAHSFAPHKLCGSLSSVSQIRLRSSLRVETRLTGIGLPVPDGAGNQANRSAIDCGLLACTRNTRSATSSRWRRDAASNDHHRPPLPKRHGQKTTDRGYELAGNHRWRASRPRCDGSPKQELNVPKETSCRKLRVGARWFSIGASLLLRLQVIRTMWLRLVRAELLSYKSLADRLENR